MPESSSNSGYQWEQERWDLVIAHECGHALQAVRLGLIPGTLTPEGKKRGDLGIFLSKHPGNICCPGGFDYQGHPTVEGRLRMLYSGWAGEVVWNGRKDIANLHAKGDFERAQKEGTHKLRHLLKRRVLKETLEDKSALERLIRAVWDGFQSEIGQELFHTAEQVQLATWTDIVRLCT
jgi:hypothetical protein